MDDLLLPSGPGLTQLYMFIGVFESQCASSNAILRYAQVVLYQYGTLQAKAGSPNALLIAHVVTYVYCVTI